MHNIIIIIQKVLNYSFDIIVHKRINNFSNNLPSLEFQLISIIYRFKSCIKQNLIIITIIVIIYTGVYVIYIQYANRSYIQNIGAEFVSEDVMQPERAISHPRTQNKGPIFSIQDLLACYIQYIVYMMATSAAQCAHGRNIQDSPHQRDDVTIILFIIIFIYKLYIYMYIYFLFSFMCRWISFIFFSCCIFGYQ